MDDPLSLAGRVVLVTGAGRGIGAATCLALARAGARVAAVDKDGAAATRTAEAIAKQGGEAHHFTGDVTDGFAVERIVDRVVEDWGRLDVLINNAGVLRDARLEAVTDEDWALTLDVNLHGTMLCTKAAAPHMLKQGRGRILTAASVVAREGNFGQTSYSASKGGVIAMTRTWARELGPKGITANCVAPGFIDTELVRNVPPKIVSGFVAKMPARRLGRAEEVANVYLFLASDMASFLNGAVVGVDGGMRL